MLTGVLKAATKHLLGWVQLHNASKSCRPVLWLLPADLICEAASYVSVALIMHSSWFGIWNAHIAISRSSGQSVILGIWPQNVSGCQLQWSSLTQRFTSRPLMLMRQEHFFAHQFSFLLACYLHLFSLSTISVASVGDAGRGLLQK